MESVATPPLERTPTSPSPSLPPEGATIQKLATKFIPFDWTLNPPSSNSLSNQDEAQSLKIEVLEDQNTLKGIYVNGKNVLESNITSGQKTEIQLGGLVTFFKNVSNFAAATVSIDSPEVAVFYFHMGIIPQSLTVPEFQDLKGIEGIILSNENRERLQKLSYPQVGIYMSKGAEDFWRITQIEKEPPLFFIQALAKQAFFSSIGIPDFSSEPLKVERDLAIEKQILSKPTRKFQIKAGRHVALMIVCLAQSGEKLSMELVDLQMEGKSVIESPLKPMEKFTLYRAAVIKFAQYLEKFPLPKEKEQEQIYASNVDFEPVIKTDSRELMNIFWRLGFAPKEKLEQVEQAYNSIIIKMNPERELLSKTIFESMSDLQLKASSTSNPEKLEPEIQKFSQLLDKDMIAKMQQLQFQHQELSTIETSAQKLLLSYIAKKTPTKLNDALILQLNAEMKKILDFLPAQALVEFFPYATFSPWYMIKLEEDDLSPEVLQEFKVLERSYELETSGVHELNAPQKSEKAEKTMDDLD